MARIYDTRRWRRLRRQKLQANPLCELCMKHQAAPRIEPAVAVDHIVAISAGGDPYPALDQLASLCAPCHNRKTRIVEQQGKELTPKVIKGCDVDGRPVDK